jgi:hypothetical protein
VARVPTLASNDGRFHSPLIEPDLPISVIRLSDGIRSRRSYWSAGQGRPADLTKLSEDVLPRIATCAGGAYFATTQEEATDMPVNNILILLYLLSIARLNA